MSALPVVYARTQSCNLNSHQHCTLYMQRCYAIGTRGVRGMIWPYRPSTPWGRNDMIISPSNYHGNKDKWNNNYYEYFNFTKITVNERMFLYNLTSYFWCYYFINSRCTRRKGNTILGLYVSWSVCLCVNLPFHYHASSYIPGLHIQSEASYGSS